MPLNYVGEYIHFLLSDPPTIITALHDMKNYNTKGKASSLQLSRLYLWSSMSCMHIMSPDIIICFCFLAHVSKRWYADD